MLSSFYCTCFSIVIPILVIITVFFIAKAIVTITITIIYIISINNKIFYYLLVDIKADISLHLFYLVVVKVQKNAFQHPYINAVYANT